MNALTLTQQVRLAKAMRDGQQVVWYGNGAFKIITSVASRSGTKPLTSKLGGYMGRRDKGSKVKARTCWNRVTVERPKH